MAITKATGDGTPEAETPLLDGVTRGKFVNSEGRPASRSKSGCRRSVSFIIGIGVAQRFGYYGISSNLITYLTGPLGRSTATAAADVNAWTGTALLMSLVGAFVADSFLGRCRTIIIVASLLYILGLGFMSLSATLHSPTQFKDVAFFFSLYLVAFAEGGLRPCIEAFGADQFDEEDKHESKSKSSFFNWWCFTMHGSNFVALLVLNYVQENLSWELGFGIPCAIMCTSLVVFLMGKTTYRFRVSDDQSNPFLRIGRGFVKMAAEEEAQLVLHHQVDGFDTQDSDDAKTILGLVPIWCTCLGYALLFSQLSTLFTKQGSTLNRSITPTFRIPAASLQSLMSLSIIASIPFYDCIFVPIARTMTKKPAGISALQRIGIGLFLSFLTMVIAALVERRRLAIAVEYDDPTTVLPMSVRWLAPQYSLLGVADVFAMVGLQEFFYDEVPAGMKSVGLALYISIFGMGNFLSGLLISVIEKVTSGEGRDSWFSNNLNKAHLDYFYWLLAGLSVVTMAAYTYFGKNYVCRRKVRLCLDGTEGR